MMDPPPDSLQNLKGFELLSKGHQSGEGYRLLRTYLLTAGARHDTPVRVLDMRLVIESVNTAMTELGAFAA